jgi:hypothetical protein
MEEVGYEIDWRPLVLYLLESNDVEVLLFYIQESTWGTKDAVENTGLPHPP